MRNINIMNIFYQLLKYNKLNLLILLIASSFKSYAAQSPEGFADVVEPLMPAVVNINTVKYNKVKEGNRRLFPKDAFPQNHPFQEFFENFGLQFFGDEMPSNPKAVSLGSGFIVTADGEIVTNNHVIADADEINIKLNNNKEYKAKIIGRDPRTDLALLKIQTDEPLPFVRFGDSGKSRVGDWVITIGNPFGLGGTVTSGIISAKSREIDIISGGLIEDYIQTDASINGGNSGGPMFNLQGEVIGVNTAILAPSGTNIGIGFAIPSNRVQTIIKQLKANGKVERGKLGITIQELTPEIAEGLGLQNIEGVIILEVDKGSAGDLAGLKPQDIIIGYEDQPIKSRLKFCIMVAETPINKKVKIKLLRQGKQMTVTSSVDSIKEVSAADEKSDDAEGANTEDLFTLNGVHFANAPSDSVKNGGVMVISHDAKSSWRGLVQKGDIITAINQVPVANLSQFKDEYNKIVKSKKKNIVFLIQRGRVNVYLALPFDEERLQK
ncbi:MAG: Do family serine endopeptidase [Alphaproteobacteria bacterium]|nr:Do family serine endopeptidase [Alphaproteobacteria bacterium]